MFMLKMWWHHYDWSEKLTILTTHFINNIYYYKHLILIFLIKIWIIQILCHNI